MRPDHTRLGLTCPAAALRAIAIVGLVAAAACGSAGTDVGNAAALEGAWHYVGTQTSGDRISYDGTVTVTQASGADFTGDFDASSSTPQGVVVRVNGVITGRADNGAIDFDLQLSSDTRRHVGRVKGDSITGTWANDDLSSIGSFTMARTP